MQIEVGNGPSRENSMCKGPEVGTEGPVKLEHIEKGAVSKRPYHAGPTGQVGILSVILRAVGANERAPRPTGKMQTHSAN